MVAPDNSQKTENMEKKALETVISAGVSTQPNISLAEANLTMSSDEPSSPAPRLPRRSASGKAHPQTSGKLETPDLQKKSKTAGFCDVDLTMEPEPKGLEDVKNTDSIQMECELEPQKKSKHFTNGFADSTKELILCDNEQHKTGHGGQVMQLVNLKNTSDEHCRKNGGTCLCQECVQNYCANNVQQPEKEEGEQAVDLSCTDNNSLKSNMDRSRSGSERSQCANSSEGENMSSKYEDTQVTLLYPDKSKPPDSITRLSNAGLYEPSEDQTKMSKTKNCEEKKDVGPQTVYPNVCVQRQCSENNTKQFHCVKVDVDKGEHEQVPLLESHQSTVETIYNGQDCFKCKSSCVKIVMSFLFSVLIFPAFLYVTYRWLPFDAPKMPDIPTRLVYTLRCGAFASFPIVLGVMIHGISRTCVSSFDPFKPQEREVKIHRRFVKQSTFLFVLYFFNLSVLATYLPQDYLKCIPLLTGLFALSQLIYWLSFAVGRSFRGFGYGMTFLPMLVMMLCNLYFMFIVEPEKMLFYGAPKESTKTGQNK
ncbi:transmembrane protein 79 [Pelobates fuscus]|uniref:transmembrane protein 79 n=1 Tax=Pelobates fuscus TaxID=191477 RepID=UPI002FE494CA